MKMKINFKLIGLALILTCPTQQAQASIGDIFKNRYVQFVAACAATGIFVGISWKSLISYKLWWSTKLEKEAVSFMAEFEKKNKTIIDLYEQTTQESEQYKHNAFSNLILKTDPTDTHFYKTVQHIQQSVKQIENYVYYLTQYKQFEHTCTTLTALKDRLIKIKEIIVRLNEYAQVTDLIDTVEHSFRQEVELLAKFSSDKDRKRAIRDLIMRSPANTDLKFVAYNQKLSRHVQLLQNCLQFSIFNSYFRKDFADYYTILNRMIETLGHIQGIVHSSHYFQLEEEVQQVRTQIRDLTRKISEQSHKLHSQNATIEDQQRAIIRYQQATSELRSKLNNAYSRIHELNNQANRLNNNYYQQAHVKPSAPQGNPPGYNPESYNQDGSAKEQSQSHNPPGYNPEFYDENGQAKK